MQTKAQSKPHQQIGIVVSDKMQKSIVVKITSKARHPMYKKVIRRERKFKAHDEENQCSIGDLVEIMETRPLSKDKRWRVTRIVRKAAI